MGIDNSTLPAALTTSPFDGDIALFRIYNSTLNGTEVQSLFDALFVPPPPLAPEPSTFILFGVLMTLLAGYYYRRRRLARLAA